MTVPDAGKLVELAEALEPFAAFARAAETIRRFRGEVISDDRIIQSVSGEAGVGILTYGHLLDALAAFDGEPKAWGGQYRNLRARAASPEPAKREEG